MTPNFLVVINVLLPIRCNIGSGMPYLHIFVEDVFVLFCAMTVNIVKGSENLSMVGIRK